MTLPQETPNVLIINSKVVKFRYWGELGMHDYGHAEYVL